MPLPLWEGRGRHTVVELGECSCSIDGRWIRSASLEQVFHFGSQGSSAGREGLNGPRQELKISHSGGANYSLSENILPGGVSVREQPSTETGAWEVLLLMSQKNPAKVAPEDMDLEEVIVQGTDRDLFDALVEFGDLKERQWIAAQSDGAMQPERGPAASGRGADGANASHTEIADWGAIWGDVTEAEGRVGEALVRLGVGLRLKAPRGGKRRSALGS